MLSLLSDPRTPLMLAAAIALLRVIYALVSRLVQPYPRLRAIVEALAALGPDLGRALLQLASAWLGRPISLDVRAPERHPDDVAMIASLRRELAELRAELLVGQPAAELAAHLASPDPGARVTRPVDEGTAHRPPGTRGAL